MTGLQSRMDADLRCREEKGILRSLRVSEGIDFSSNDYLGFAASTPLLQRVRARMASLGQLGSTGSRLLTGNQPLHEEIEAKLAAIFGMPSALLFSSGYALNAGLLGALGKVADVLILDELVHASLKDGARLSGAKTLFFRHNDLDHLERRLRQNQGAHALIAVESVYSMDGDLAPLAEIMALAQTYGAEVIVDEAHAIGTVGPSGLGLLHQLGLSGKVFAQVITFGKALGVEGAAVLGPPGLRRHLVNHCHSFIYSTAPSLPVLTMVDEALALFMGSRSEVEKLHRNMALFSRLSGAETSTPIHAVKLGCPIRARAVAADLSREGFRLHAILSPTVKSGTERVRIVLHSFNSAPEIEHLCHALGRSR